MKAVVGLLFLALVAAASALAPLNVPRGEYVQDEYIVVLKKGMPVEARDVHIKELQADFTYSQGVNEIKRTFHINDFVAFSAKLSQDMLARERANEDVRYIDRNGIAKALDDTCHIQSDATWGLDRINEVGIQLDGQYNYGANGEGVDAYIIDTGIQVTHKDFGGRATWGTNTIDDEDVDCNGHGTHVAGTVGGSEYGVAKAANLIAVKTLDCYGSGTWDAVIEGVNWTADQGKSTRAAGRRSVANMSLGGGLVPAVNEAVEAAIATGIPFAIAAGNSNDDACNYSPASVPTALTTGATTVVNKGSDAQADRRASFSSYGSCVDIFAPGQLITSAWIGNDDAVRTISGTSMAAPHVAGAAAVVLSANPDFTIEQVAEALGAASTKSVIDLACGSSTICQASPNALLYSHCA